LHGEIHFAKSKNNEKLVDVKAFLETTIQYPEQSWTWGVHQNPVDYSIIDPVQRCDLDHVGPQIINFDDLLGFLLLPGNESSVWNDVKLNLTGEFATFLFDYRVYPCNSHKGESGLWGKSLVMFSADTNFRICSTITSKMSSMEHTAEAKFRAGVAGSMHFRWMKSEDSFNSDLLIYSSLYHIQDSNRYECR
jgi:hypothetical protein